MTAALSLPWMEVFLAVAAVLALFSSVRFFFPGVVASPFRWSLVGFHRPWKPFPPREMLEASRAFDEVCDSLLEEFLLEAGIGALFFGEDLRLQGLNGAARRMLGNAQDVWMGQRAGDFLPKELAEIVAECWQDKLHSHTGNRAVALGASSKESVVSHAILLHDKAGDFYGVALFLTKATVAQTSADKAADRSLPLDAEPDRTRQLASLGLHAAGMAHEIKNPLVALKTFAELLPTKFDDPEFRDHFSKLAMHQIRRIDGIVNDLLDYARPKPPEGEFTDPVKLLQEALGILSVQIKENKIRVKEIDAEDCADVWIDVEQLRRVFINILLNAVEAMPNGGELSMRSFRTGKGALQIIVADSGPGISPKALDHVFEPFFTTKKKGSGLGLAISKRIVEDHGGTIEFKNGKVGALCVITLPVPQDAPKSKKTKASTSTRRVLSDFISKNDQVAG